MKTVLVMLLTFYAPSAVFADSSFRFEGVEVGFVSLHVNHSLNHAHQDNGEHYNEKNPGVALFFSTGDNFFNEMSIGFVTNSYNQQTGYLFGYHQIGDAGPTAFSLVIGAAFAPKGYEGDGSRKFTPVGALNILAWKHIDVNFAPGCISKSGDCITTLGWRQTF